MGWFGKKLCLHPDIHRYIAQLSDTSNSSERVKESRVQMSEVKGQQKRKVTGALRALRAV